MDCRNVYTSAGCNSLCQNIDWKINGLVVFGASYSCVVLEKNKESLYRVKSTYNKHKAKVNTVKWITRDDVEDCEFISGGDDNVAIVWKVSNLHEPRILEGHTGSVNSVGSIAVAGTLLLATGSSDGTVRLWKSDLGEFAVFQKISLGAKICLSLNLTCIQNSDKILLALAATDNNIELYMKSASGESEFIKLCKLVGHENWVRGLDFVQVDGNDVLLASSSQDASIRLWRLSSKKKEKGAVTQLDDLFSNHLNENLKYAKDNIHLKVSLESILQGHEDWVFGVHWHKKGDGLQLLSSSIDKSMILWQQIDNIWCETARLGVIGGNASGFFGGKISGDGHSVLGYGFLGSLYFWEKSENMTWKPLQSIEGHSASVSDISWNKNGMCVLSVSVDKTSRVHASSPQGDWQVLARPQIHGFGIQCVAWLDSSRYVSGAEEKVIRVFEAPSDFLTKNNPQLSYDFGSVQNGTYKTSTIQNPLGLSNKTVDEENTSGLPEADSFRLDGMLWPETYKLYGHCHEVFAIACSPDLKYVASSAKAFNPEDSCVLIWFVSTWKLRQKLSAHSLTVTDLEFSKNSRYLLAVSRDRRWSLYTTNSNGDFVLVEIMDKSLGVHNRVLWSCDWSHDDLYFATSSRDGKLAVWNISPLNESSKPKLADYHELKNESITACAFGCRFYNHERYVLAIGTEKGVIKLFEFNEKLSELLTVMQCDAHHLTVRRLRFRPQTNLIQLASCGDDNFVKINEFCFGNC